MAPSTTHVINGTPEYHEFIAALREYHLKRGTNFDPEPKVGQTAVDLLQLFKLIVEHGGYDKVSEEKLAWRNMVNILDLHSSNEASAAYSLKLAYYKNLAAYEISTVHKREPPPPEILEHISAKGGGLLTRTLENFGGHRMSRPSGGSHGIGGGFDDRSGDDMSTPDRRGPGDDGTPVSGRASRGLREAPPQRVIFQPDTGPARQVRHGSGHGGPGSNVATPNQHHSGMAGQPHGAHHMHPQHPQLQYPHMQQQHPQIHVRGASSMHNPSGTDAFSPAVQAYEPRGPVPIVLQPVDSPATMPAKYLQQQRLQRLEAAGVSLRRFATRPPIPPGNEGPNIYVRCLGALRSGIYAEEAFALSHLVKISFERGDKYKFESFPGLAEGLLEKALQVGQLFYQDIQWTVSYDAETDESDLGELDGVNGTADILERIAQLRPRDDAVDCLQTEDFANQIVLITEAALTIRNMVTLQENALFISEFPPCRDFLCIVLNLPERDAVTELKHSALDIAEQLTPYLTLDDDDPLYRTLLQQLASSDRGTVLTALRAVGRISMNMTQTNRLGNVPASVLQSVANWLLLNDDELMDACLDFLYQYTAVAANVEQLLRSVKTEGLVSHLVRLLSHGARRGHRELVLQPERKLPATEEVLPLPPELLTQLVAVDEPDRCYTWLRCFFEEDPEASITQIAIWQAYQAAFLQPVQQSGRTMLGAAEFIRNVTHVYHSAGAQIQKEQTPQGEVQKFIIKGIRPRVRPISPDGRELFSCQWRSPSAARPAQRCSVFFGSADTLFAHIVSQHLEEKADDKGAWPNKQTSCCCRWADCRRFPKPTNMALADFLRHVKTHAVAAECDQRPPKPAASSSSSAGQQEQQAQSPSQKKQEPQQQQQQHQRQRSSVTNGDLAASNITTAIANGVNGASAVGSSSGGATTTAGSTIAGAGGSGSGSSSANKRQTQTYIVPAKTMNVAYEETATMRDERNPNLPPQAAGIPLSAVLVLRNIARNAVKADVDMEDVTAGKEPAHAAGDGHGPHELARGEPGGWNERLFRPMLPRLYEIMAENRALASYITSLFQLIGEEW